MNNRNIYEKNKNMPKKRLSSEDYEGVIYTPSQKRGSPAKNTQNKPMKNRPNKPVKKVKAKKSQYKLFMLITIISGILIFFTVFAVAYTSLRKDSKENTYLEETSTEFNANNLYSSLSSNKQAEADDIEKSDEAGKSIVCVIQNLNTLTRLITFYDVSTGEIYNVAADDSTEITNKFNEKIELKDLSIGEIANVSINSSMELLSVQKSADYWELENVKGIKIDMAQKTLKYNSAVYSYDDKAIKFLYNGADIDPSKINEADVLTIRGYENKAWVVIVNKSHGTLTLTNKDHIENGIIEIDTDIYKTLSDAEAFELSEGKHKVVIKGDNIDPLSHEVTITPSEDAVLDLSVLAKAKTGTLYITTNVNDYALYVDNMLELSRAPLTLSYGVHQIKIMKEGYVTFEKQVTIKSPQTTLTADVKKEVYMGTLTVNSTPSGAQLYINGNYAGITPYSGDVAQGTYTITVKKSGYKDLTISSIYVETKKEKVFNIDLQSTEETLANN